MNLTFQVRIPKKALTISILNYILTSIRTDIMIKLLQLVVKNYTCHFLFTNKDVEH